MTLHIENLSIQTTIPAQQLLRAWSWLFSLPLEIVMITKFGDAFLIDPSSGDIFFLDTLDGELEHIAPSIADFRTLLSDQEFITDYFSLDLLAAFIHLEMPENTVYNFHTPPVLGGELEEANIELFDLQTHFDDLGRLWYEISQLDIDEEQ